MKLLLAFVMGAVCVYALRRKRMPEDVAEWARLVETSWRDWERVDAV